VDFLDEAPWSRATFWLTCITIDPAAAGTTAEAVRLRLADDDIESRPVWKPMHLQPVFRSCRVIGGSVAAGLFERGLCLPSGSDLVASDRERIAELVCAGPA
jgi:pyridoxal phosphate-dependent aminotransferase EpsN